MTVRLPGSLVAATALWIAAVAISAPTDADAQQPPAPRTREDLSAFLPPGDGRALVAKQCSTCHDLKSVVRLRASKEAWEAVVLDMVARGAPLMIEEADAIWAYLGNVFGPKAPPLVDINVASQEEMLKLPGMTPAIADRVESHRRQKGPFSSREQLRTVLNLDEATFEKVKWYIRAGSGS